MRFLITGIAGFAGSTLARALIEATDGIEIIGLDNFSRSGSERNRSGLTALGVRILHGDIRNPSDLEVLPNVDFVIDAAANPSVLAGVDGRTSSRQLIEHNLWGTVNLLEFCKARKAGFILLSTSRVYSIQPLNDIKYEVNDHRFHPVENSSFPPGLSPAGIDESYPTQPPLSLYGTTKLASEQLALEYGSAFDFPAWINRCGVLAGAGQFGRPDQGIFSYWIHSYREKRPLRYIGFGGNGHQVRDCLHPRDLVPAIRRQLEGPQTSERVFNFSGGIRNSMSLRQLTDWCEARFPGGNVASDPAPREFDIPWMVLDHGRANRELNWQPQTSIREILHEIAEHAASHPDWLTVSGA